MRHLKAGRKLGRNATHRLALNRNLALALFRHERIITTVEKAKEARPFIEKLITLARKGTLHARRLVMARLGTPSKAEVTPHEDPDKADTRTILTKLFNEIAPRFASRPGGYTRIIKRHRTPPRRRRPYGFPGVVERGRGQGSRQGATVAPGPGAAR